MSETEKLTPLMTILTKFYNVNQTVLQGLEKEYGELSEEDKKFLNDRITVLLDFHDRYSSERENYPELTRQLYRLQVNALRVFLQEKIKQIEASKPEGSQVDKTALLRAVNDILEKEINEPKIIKGTAQSESTLTNEQQNNKIQEEAKKIADGLVGEQNKLAQDQILKLGLEKEELQKSLDEAIKSDETDDAEYEKQINDQTNTINDQSQRIKVLEKDVEDHSAHKDNILKALGQITGSPVSAISKATAPPGATAPTTEQTKLPTAPVVDKAAADKAAADKAAADKAAADKASADKAAADKAAADKAAADKAAADKAATTTATTATTVPTIDPAQKQEKQVIDKIITDLPQPNVQEQISETEEETLDNITADDELNIPEGANSGQIASLLGDKMGQIKRNQSVQRGGAEQVAVQSNVDLLPTDPYESLDKNDDYFEINKNKLDLLADSQWFNTDTILQIIGLLSDPELFKEFHGRLYKSGMKEFIDLFFVDVNRYIESKGNKIQNNDAIYTYLENKVDLKTQDLIVSNLRTIIERDTYHYNNLIPENTTNKMFIYTAIIILSNEEAWFISQNQENATGYYKLFIEIRQKISTLVDQFEKVLKSQKGPVREIYEKFLYKRNKVFTFIKERNDNINIGQNPRFEISTLPHDSKSLKIKYMNVDGQVNGNVNEKKNSLKKKMEQENKVQEEYVLGPFNGVFLANRKLNNRQIAEQIHEPIFEKIFRLNEDFCMIGYGQSGSGKTSTLIYYDREEEDGIVTELCNLPDFVNQVEQINMALTNIYLVHGSGVEKMSSFKDEFYKTVPIKLGAKEPVFIYGQAIRPGKPPKQMWYMEEDGKIESVGAYIAKAFDKREVEPTPNNPNSSRSHVVITLFLKLKNGTTRRLIVCDLAGVENVFACESNTEIVKFSEQYQRSNQYGEKGKQPIKFDRYSCDQEEVPGLSVRESKLYDSLQPDAKKLSNDYNYSAKSVEANKVSVCPKTKKGKQRGGDGCIAEGSVISGCSTGFLFQNLHNGNSSTELWDDFKFKVKQLMEPFLLSYKLTQIAKMYVKVDSKNKRKIADLGEKYKNIYQEVKVHNYRLYPGVPTGKPYYNGQVVLYGKDPAVDLATIDKVVDNKAFGPIILDSKHDAYCEEKKTNPKAKEEKSVISKMKIPTLSKEQMSVTDEEGNILWSTTNESAYDLYQQILCEEYRIEALKYNCILRRNEGFMINKSLYDLRQDVKTIIMNTLQPLPNAEGKSYMPMFWDKLVLPYCRNLNVDDEVLLKYYSDPKPEPTPLGSKILKVMETDFNNFNQKPTGDFLDIESFRSMNFGVFTVINTTNNERTNNPPTPPYLNINRLKYYALVNFNADILKNEILDLALNKMKTYTYYTNNNKDYEKYLSELENNSNLEGKSDSILISMGKSLIDLIETANPSTLIGSLESTLIIQNITYDELTCFRDSKRESLLEKFSPIGVKPFQTANSFKNKYLKYKKKYMIELKKLGKI